MIRLFDEKNLKDKPGIFHNPEVFNINQRDVDEFDKQFEFKQKMILDSQLKEI